MDKTLHLNTKYTLARFSLIESCEGDELRFYLYVKLYAINKSSAFPSFFLFNRDLKWNKQKCIRLIHRLEKKKRLKVKRTSGKNNIYDITWYDKMNEKTDTGIKSDTGIKTDTRTGVRTDTLTSNNRTSTIFLDKSKKIDSRKSKKQQKKKIESSKKFSLPDYFKEMKKDKKKHIQFLARFFQYRKLKFSSKKEVQAAIVRFVKIAKKLVETYKDKDLQWAAKYCKNAYPNINWTPETMFKALTSVNRSSDGKNNFKKQKIKSTKYSDIKVTKL